MHESEEALKAEDREYSNPDREQAQRMEVGLGPELNRKLEIMAAKLEVINKVRDICNDEIVLAGYMGVKKLMKILDSVEQEIKAELKGV